ncbi:MAG: hypothetical protein M0005_09910 [Actinomycetota bacterium]|nr:hypothetical protein [Actinomycetota bacterium]
MGRLRAELLEAVVGRVGPTDGVGTVPGALGQPRSSRTLVAIWAMTTMRPVFTRPTTCVQPRRTFSVSGLFKFPKPPSARERRLNDAVHFGPPQ